MMKYANFSSSDFAADEGFRRWVYHPDAASNRFWKDWCAQHPEKQAAVEEAQQLLLSLRFKDYTPSAEEKREVWHRINQARTIAVARVVRRRTMVRRWATVAATFAGVLLLGLTYLYSGWFDSREQVYTAAYGTTQTIILADQSTVELNANSTLRVSTDWTRQREVWLEGEAFFKVQPQRSGAGKKVPFLVHTDELLVEVVGTQFNVRSRRGETQVGLSSGKVTLALPAEENPNIDMQPGDWVAFTQKAQRLEKSQLAPATYTAWRDHRLRFDGHRLSEVRTVLEDYYGYQVTFSDEALANRTFSGEFPTDRTDLLLAAIEAALEVTVSRQDNEISIAERR